MMKFPARLDQRVARTVLALSLLALMPGCYGRHAVGIIGVSTQGSSPGRLYNATRGMDTTLNLADAAEAGCAGGPRAADAAVVVANARAAAANLQAAMDMFNDTPEAYARVAAALKATAQAGNAAYYMAMSCGAVPPDVPNIPVYTEEFWDVSSP